MTVSGTHGRRTERQDGRVNGHGIAALLLSPCCYCGWTEQEMSLRSSSGCSRIRCFGWECGGGEEREGREGMNGRMRHDNEKGVSINENKHAAIPLFIHKI